MLTIKLEDACPNCGTRIEMEQRLVTTISEGDLDVFRPDEVSKKLARTRQETYQHLAAPCPVWHHPGEDVHEDALSACSCPDCNSYFSLSLGPISLYCDEWGEDVKHVEQTRYDLFDGPRVTFLNWLREMWKKDNRPDSVADFARAVFGCPSVLFSVGHPRDAMSYRDWRVHLHQIGVHREWRQAFETAWSEFWKLQGDTVVDQIIRAREKGQG